jgi:misacylated tRNA(Ala) deacylase
MTKPMFIDDAYLRDADARVFAVTDEGGIILDASIFYATSGGQPGDSGRLTWQGGAIDIATAVKGEGGTIILVPAEPNALPTVGTKVTQSLNWERRHRHMRVHTALHLLSVVIPLPVTGGSIGAEKGRLDFDMPDAIADKTALQNTLNELIDCDFDISTEWIDESELAANPELVKTMSVAPPKGAGRIRMVRIGTGENTADYQPCGGTHVRNTSEIGRVLLGKVEKKGKQNRRVYLQLDT